MPASGPARPEEMPAEWLKGDRVSILYQHKNPRSSASDRLYRPHLRHYRAVSGW